MRKQAILNALALAGLGCMGYGGYRLYRNWSFVDSAKRTTALVTHLERKLDDGETEFHERDKVDRLSRSSYETIVFTSESNERIVWQSPISASWQSGDGATSRMMVPDDRSVEILYDPADPQHFEYASTGALWWQWSILLALGLGLTYLACGGLNAIARLLGVTFYRSTAMSSEQEADHATAEAPVGAERYRLR